MIEGNFLPMSDREEELMDDLFSLTRDAYNDGVPKVRIAGILAFFAAGAIDPKSLNAEDKQVQYDTEDLEARMNAETEDEPDVCPSCKEEGTYTEISDVRSQLGGQLLVEPCGCVIEWENREKLGEWVEEFDPFDDE